MRVLLADDQAWMRSAFRLLLEHEENIEVVGETENLRALPQFVSRLRPDLLFLDWQLSGLDTNSARRRLLSDLHELYPHLYVIAVTNDDHAKNCLLLGADAFVNKSEPPERILTVVQQAANRNLSLGGHAAGELPLL